MELPSQEPTPADSRPQSAPLGSVTYRPDIDLLDERGLMSYITENYEREPQAESDPNLCSERLRDAVAQVNDTLPWRAGTITEP